jgi:hypothetical protein
MINNKGAMELSINTIVIIVIGVTLLSLGLIFVKGVFDKLDGQSDQIFEGGENEISKIANHDQKLSVKQQVNVKQGADAVFKVWVVNFEDDVSDFTVEIEPSSSNPFGERVNIQLANNEATLDIGGEAGFVTVVVADDNAPLESGGYKIVVSNSEGVYGTAGFFVTVEK